ncbi:MAG TPA: Ig-like domain-containing protein [Solirubrobacteraceae bacterium]
MERANGGMAGRMQMSRFVALVGLVALVCFVAGVPVAGARPAPTGSGPSLGAFGSGAAALLPPMVAAPSAGMAARSGRSKAWAGPVARRLRCSRARARVRGVHRRRAVHRGVRGRGRVARRRSRCRPVHRRAAGSGPAAGASGGAGSAAVGSQPTVPDAPPAVQPDLIASGVVSVGSLPAGVAATNSRGYVANAEDDTVSVLDLTADPVGVVDTVPVGSFPDGVAVSSDGSQVYVTNFRSGTLSIIDTSTDTVAHTVTVGKDPDGVIRVGSSVYVANLLSGTVSVVDPTSATVTGTVTLTGSPGTPAPSGLAVSQDASTLYVDDAQNGATDTVDLGSDTQTGSVSVGTWPSYLAVAGSTAYVANATRNGSTPGTVSVLDLSSSPPTVAHTVAVGAHPYGITVDAGLGEVFAANSSDDTLSIIDTATHAEVATAAVGTTPDALALTPDGSTVLETNEGDNTVGILHVDQPPVNTVPGAQAVDANGPSGTNALTFSSAHSNLISTTDPDAGSSPVKVTLSVSGGTLSLSGTSGLSFSSGGDGSGAMTFTGTLTDVNAALDGLKYTPGTNFQGADALSMTVDDQGNTGLGEPQSASSTVPISVNNVAPTVGNVSYSGAIGNTAFGVGTSPPAPSNNTSGSVLSNSSDANGDNLSAVSGSITTAHSGTVSMNTDGTFTYDPPAGFTGDDTFTFQVSDGTTTSSATATVTVLPVRVWYVDSSASGAGSGTSTDPFQSLSSAQSSDGTGDYVYLYPGSYTGGFAMQQSEQLIGRPQDLVVFNGTTNVKLIDGSGSTNPSIGNSGGNGVTLAQGDTIQRVDISSTGGAALAGSGINSLTTGSNMTLSTSGGGGAGLSLTGGGNGTVGVGAAVQNTVGKQVNISGRTGGTTTLSGAIGGTGTGVSLTSNTGATINLTGPVAVSTGSSGAFVATGGGTVSSSNTASTLATTTGTALDVENTTIGSSNLVFQSISAGNSSSAPLNGILLSSTGNGALTVTGTGTTAGSGGTIQKATDTTQNATHEPGDISINNAGPVELDNMTIDSAARNGIAVLDVPKLTLKGDTIDGSGNDGVFFKTNATTGTFNLDSNKVTNSTGSAIYTEFQGGGTWTGHVTNNTVGNSAGANPSSNGSNGGEGIDVKSTGANSIVTADVSSNNITGVKQSNGILAEALDSACCTNPALNLSLASNTVDLESNAAQDGINVVSGSTSSRSPSVCLNATTNSSVSKGLAADNPNQFDSDGMYVHNEDTSSTFAVVDTSSGSYTNVGAGNEQSQVESALNSANPGLQAGPGPTSQPSIALQDGSAAFTKVTTCPTAPAPSIAFAAPPAPAPVKRLRGPAASATAGSATPTRTTRAAIEARLRAHLP